MKHPRLPAGGDFFDRRSSADDDERQEMSLKVEKVCRSCRKHRRGVAAVEFAIVAPVFFLMILGMIEVGRAVMVQQIITNASREGARLAVLPGTEATDVMNRVEDILSSQTIIGATVEILNEDGTPTNPEDAEYGDVIKVTVSVPFSEVSWMPPWKYFKEKTLAASTIMRTERVQ